MLKPHTRAVHDLPRSGGKATTTATTVVEVDRSQRDIRDVFLHLEVAASGLVGPDVVNRDVV